MALQQFIGAPEDEAKKKKLERVQQQNASIIQEQKAPAISPVETTAGRIWAPKPKVATKANPVVEITTKKPDPAYSPIDFAEIEQMDNNWLQDYIDRATVKTSQGNPLTEQEQLKVVKAWRLLAQKQAQSAANPYTGMIGEEQAQRDALQSQLAARRQTAVETQENALQQGYGEKKQRLYEEWKQQQQAAQSVLSFSWFGRSTYAADQQVKIEQNVQRAMAVLDAEREAAIEKYRLQQEWADADTLATYDNYIKQLQQKSAERIGENMKMVNEMNQENAASYQDKIKNILALSQQMQPAEPLTPEQQKIADSYATLAIDKDGNINEAFMKMIPSNLVSGVLQKAAELRADVQPEGEYQYIQWDKYNPAVVFNKATGKYEPAPWWVAWWWSAWWAVYDNGSGEASATGLQKYSQYFNPNMISTYTKFVESWWATRPTEKQIRELWGYDIFSDDARNAYIENENKKLNAQGFSLTDAGFYSTMSADERKTFNSDTRTIKNVVYKIDELIKTIQEKWLPVLWQTMVWYWSQLKQKVSDLQLQLKNEGVYNLWVLNGPDLSVINSVLPQMSPTQRVSWEDNYLQLLKGARQMYIDQVNQQNLDKWVVFSPGGAPTWSSQPAWSKNTAQSSWPVEAAPQAASRTPGWRWGWR